MNPLIRFSVILLIFYTVSAEDEFVYNSDLRISYKYHKVPLKWLDAKTICAEEDARLAMPKTNSEALAILNIFEINHSGGDPAMMFLDSHDYFEDHEFITRDYYIQYFYHSWGVNQPGNDTKEHCVVMGKDGKIYDNSCESSFEFICQKEDSSNIKSWKQSIDGPKSFDDPAYMHDPLSGKYFKLHMHMRPWNIARAICHAEGGQLAIIRSKHEENFLLEMLNDSKNRYPFSQPFAFLGFHDLYRFHQWYTVTDEKLTDVGYVNWAPGEPNNSSSLGERCGSLKEMGGLNDYGCHKLTQFFCEK